jgi:RNA polymerase sigma-70 factor (ECF subfamily)
VRSPPVSSILVARAQTGDRDALNVVLKETQDRLHAHVLSMVGDGDEALDILQGVLLIIARKLPALRDPRWFRAWSYRIATREAVRRHRRDRVWREALRDDALEMLEAGPTDDPHLDPVMVEALLESVDALPPASRLVVRLHYLDGLSYVEVAEALEIPVGTVRSRLNYARDVLRKRLGGASHR